MDQVLGRVEQMRSMSYAVLALSLGCGGANKAVGSGGTGTTSQTTGAAPTTSAGSTSTGKVATVASSSSTGMPFVCTPPAQAGTLYEDSANEFGTLAPISMCQYRNDVLLIVDTAAE